MSESTEAEQQLHYLAIRLRIKQDQARDLRLSIAQGSDRLVRELQDLSRNTAAGNQIWSSTFSHSCFRTVPTDIERLRAIEEEIKFLTELGVVAI